ncbi:T9SS type A sorting domain-containing protein [candidate division KSB1 bacterium]|nr:T9SS type A sorting domain-containing protein [candidate division KSB1 bacterium]
MVRKLLLIGFALSWAMYLHSNANPIIPIILSEIKPGITDWRIELINEVGFDNLDGWRISTLTDTAEIIPGISIGLFVVLSVDSLVDSLSVNPEGDVVGVIWPMEYLPIDEIRFGNVDSAVIAAPLAGQTICAIEGYPIYLDNTPTLGAYNDFEGAIGTVSGQVTDSQGSSIADALISYSYDFTTTDSSGYYQFSNYACWCNVHISAQNFQDTSFSFQIYPDSTVVRNIVLQSAEAVRPQTDAVFPSEYFLSQNYPNPFNAVTAIEYDLPEPGRVTIRVFNIFGKEVVTLKNEHQPPGHYQILWDASGLPSGIYFCRMGAGDFVQVRKIILVK